MFSVIGDMSALQIFPNLYPQLEFPTYISAIASRIGPDFRTVFTSVIK